MEKKSYSKSGRNQYISLIVAIVVIIGIAVGFMLYLAWPLLTGKTIILATQPVDPFDIFRGQYITIGYEINRIPAIEGAAEGDSVYVLLKEDDSGIWRYKSASLIKPSSGDVIRGEIKFVSRDQMSVEYGIEQYFFERGASFSMQNLSVEARISSTGGSSIIRLLQNGKPLEIEYKEIEITS